MKILVRAIVTGFGLSVGAALYRKVAKELGWDQQKDANAVTNVPPTSPHAHGGRPEPLRSV
jgi:hypothetical protein